MSADSPAIARAITKSIGIARVPAKVFGYLSDGLNWPNWAIVNVKSVSVGDDPGWLDMVTTRGTARLRIRANVEYGILDHDFIDQQASWTVFARVIANGSGAEFMMTLLQPPGFSDAFFDEQINLVDIELAALKQLLESMPAD